MDQTDERRTHFEYFHRVAQIRAFLPELERQLLDPIRLVSGTIIVDWRIKPLESVTNKIKWFRQSNRSRFDISDLNDLLGVKVIIINSRAAEDVRQICRSRFHVLDDGVVESRSEHFNFYHRSHVVLDRQVGRIDSDLPGRFEVQIVSAASQAVADVLHSLQYLKDPASIDPGHGGVNADGVEEASISAESALQGADKLDALICEFAALLDMPGVHEKQDIHPFLHQNTFLIHPASDNILSEAPIGLGTQYRLDFMIRRPTGEYMLVELENPNQKLFTRVGNPSASLSHAVQQVEDWQEWIEQNLSTMQRVYPDILAPYGMIIIGRSATLTGSEINKLKRRNINTRGRLEIQTYDDMILNARAWVTGIRRHLQT